MNNASSVAVRTLNTKRPEIMNNFTKTKHTTFFEMVDLSGQPAKGGANPEKEHQTIQKLMAVPVIASGKVAVAIQVARKGKRLITAGPDFTAADLQMVVGMAAVLPWCRR